MNKNVSRLDEITVLYCEDEKELRDATCSILNNFTKKQFIACDGSEGLELFKQYQDEIDLIVTDVNMPNMNGLEMSEQIKEINPDIPIIVATAFSNSEYLLEAINLGIDKYVLKPINIKSLLNMMSQSLIYHELRDLYRDSLTHLPTRNALLKDLNNKDDSLVALIDIDNFSLLNDLYGEENGDAILIEFSKKIIEHFAEHHKIYRVGADKFVIVSEDKRCTQKNLKEESIEFSNYIDNHGIKIKEYDVYFSITIGIAVSSDKHAYEYSQRVVQKARQSFVSVMSYDKNTFDKKEDFEENLLWIKKLKTGISDGHFKPYFQPIVDAQTQKIYKYESLIRYIDENGEEVAPYKFLPVAKKAKLFPIIIQIMLLGSIKIVQEKNIKIAVNISYDDITNDDTMEFIFKTLEKYSDEAKFIDFELLESEEISDFSLVRNFIDKARLCGCRVGVDDFGAGYSNFNMLEALNIDFVKIDGSLIRNIDKLPKQALIVETISGFCQKLGIETVAEFVSSENIYKVVKDFGIDYAQGWYFGKAMASKDI